MYTIIISFLAPGSVLSLTISSVNVTSITIQWDRIFCQEHNGRIDAYRVVYYPTLNPSDRVARTVIGTGDNDRVFSVDGLPPRTSYTFEVQASNPIIDVRGPPAFYTANTTAPQGKCNHIRYVRIHMHSNDISFLQTLVFSWMVSSILTTVL